MSDLPLGFFARLRLALRAFGRILSDGAFAAGILRLERGELAGAVAPAAVAEPSKPLLRDTAPDSALQLLALLTNHCTFFLSCQVPFVDAEGRCHPPSCPVHVDIIFGKVRDDLFHLHRKLSESDQGVGLLFL